MKRIITRPWRDLWGLVWLLSEFSGIGLARFAPWVFGQMIGAKGRRPDDARKH